MNDALWDVLPYIALEEYWIETEEGVAKAPAFFIVYLSNGYHLILNNLGTIRVYKKLKQAQDRIKELVESANYPMKVYRKKDRKINPHPFAENLIRRAEPLNEDTPLRAFDVKEWETSECKQKSVEDVKP
jgi:hypothetical protein